MGEELAPDSDDEFGDSELAEEPTEDLASSEEESDKLEEAESNQELPEDSAVLGEEVKEAEVPESHEQPKEGLNVATEHDSTPADVAMENKTQDNEVLKVVL